MQALYLLALDPVAETLAEPNSYGFRLERSTADAIDQCHRVLSLRTSAQWIFEGDIRACFDSLSHDVYPPGQSHPEEMAASWLHG